jgi:hypothetical protein
VQRLAIFTFMIDPQREIWLRQYGTVNRTSETRKYYSLHLDAITLGIFGKGERWLAVGRCFLRQLT